VEAMDPKQVEKTLDLLNTAAEALSDAECLHEGKGYVCLLCQASAEESHNVDCLIGAIREGRFQVEGAIARIEEEYPEICQLPLKPALTRA